MASSKQQGVGCDSPREGTEECANAHNGKEEGILIHKGMESEANDTAAGVIFLYATSASAEERRSNSMTRRGSLNLVHMGWAVCGVLHNLTPL